MPKRQKESKLLPGEGRPSGGLNLGDFLVTPAQQRPGQAAQAPVSSASEEAFPSLGGLSISSKPPVSNVGVWGQSKDSIHGSAKATKIESSYLNEIPLQMSPKGMWGPENMKIKNFRWGLFEFYIFLY